MWGLRTRYLKFGVGVGVGVGVGERVSVKCSCKAASVGMFITQKTRNKISPEPWQ